MANTLFLRLESPLQSWGENSQWSERRTAPEPTKSGVVGLLACALGWADDQQIGDLTARITIGIRADIPGTPAPLRDYHTVGGGYSSPQLLTAQGKLKVSSGRPHTEQTWRYYLCDASFLVAIQSHPDTIARLAEALQRPNWPVFLGRKSCPPTRPVFDGVANHDSLEAALENHPARLLEQERKHMIDPRPRTVIECAPHTAGAVRRRDQIISRDRRSFGPRYVREDRTRNEIQIETPVEGE
jgi:CRISPR system Cascade subunit CasD